MSRAPTVDVVVPEGYDDPTRPSGGNTYDRRLCEELPQHGWAVRVHAVRGSWPWAGREGHRSLAEALESRPDGAVVVLDGLVASGVPAVLVPASRRLRMVVLMHLPLGVHTRQAQSHECSVVKAAAAVVTTSEWSRGWLLSTYGVDPSRVHVARPGVDRAEPASASSHGGNLLCVGSVTPLKGHDVLVAALSRLAGVDWRCTWVGSLTAAPDFVAELRESIDVAGLTGRITFTGPLVGTALDAAYRTADVVVHTSRTETFGMVLTEALARGIPVVAAHVGGVPEALGLTADGAMPGLLIPPGDAAGLADVLELWLHDPALREGLRAAARRRRNELPGWADTAHRVSRVLTEVTA